MSEENAKIDPWFQHEGLDRAHMLLCMIEQAFGFYDVDAPLEENEVHPAIWNDRCGKLLSDATSAIADLYQAIGEWENERPPSTDTHDMDEDRIDRIAASHGDGEHYGEAGK